MSILQDMIRWRAALAVLLALVGGASAPANARAEWREAIVGIMGGASFPIGLGPAGTALPALVAWAAGVEALYGVTDNLDLRGTFSTSRFTGRLDGWTVPGSSSYRGAYTFDAAHYHSELGVRYKLYGGYNLAPYFEASAGYIWTVYTHGAVRRHDTAASVPDVGRGHLTAGAGLAVDYRLANAAFVGVAVRYTHIFGGLAKGTVSLPLYASYYW